jgi:hypothetical protein
VPTAVGPFIIFSHLHICSPFTNESTEIAPKQRVLAEMLHTYCQCGSFTRAIQAPLSRAVPAPADPSRDYKLAARVHSQVQSGRVSGALGHWPRSPHNVAHVAAAKLCTAHSKHDVVVAGTPAWSNELVDELSQQRFQQMRAQLNRLVSLPSPSHLPRQMDSAQHISTAQTAAPHPDRTLATLRSPSARTNRRPTTHCSACSGPTSLRSQWPEPCR